MNLDQKIKATRARLTALYRERERLPKPRAKPRPSFDEQCKFSYGLRKTGLSIKQIAQKMDRTPSTIRWHIKWAIHQEAQTRLLSEGRATCIKPNQHGGETWDYELDDLLRKISEVEAELPHPSTHKEKGPDIAEAS